MSLPTESEFQTSLNNLTKELHSILTNFYEKEPDSEEFRNLLGYALVITSETETRENDKQQLLNLLNQAQKDPKFAKSQEFMDKLLSRVSTNSIDDNQINTFTAMADNYGNLTSYQATNSRLSYSLESFFRLAEFFGAIPESSKAKIQDSLQIAQRYLYNQSGNIDNSFKVGDYVISFEGDPSFTDPFLYGGNFSISYQKSDEFLTSLASNFDSTQSFFDILNKREQLEKQNQELHNKQSFNGIPNAFI